VRTWKHHLAGKEGTPTTDDRPQFSTDDSFNAPNSNNVTDATRLTLIIHCFLALAINQLMPSPLQVDNLTRPTHKASQAIPSPLTALPIDPTKVPRGPPVSNSQFPRRASPVSFIPCIYTSQCCLDSVRFCGMLRMDLEQWIASEVRSRSNYFRV